MGLSEKIEVPLNHHPFLDGFFPSKKAIQRAVEISAAAVPPRVERAEPAVPRAPCSNPGTSESGGIRWNCQEKWLVSWG